MLLLSEGLLFVDDGLAGTIGNGALGALVMGAGSGIRYMGLQGLGGRLHPRPVVLPQPSRPSGLHGELSG